MTATDVGPLVEEVRQLAAGLKPREFFARLRLWEKGGLAGGMSTDLVKRSREAKLPQLDRMDRKIAEVRDRYRQAWRLSIAAQQDDDWREARRQLWIATALEAQWLFPIEVAPEALRGVVSDDPSCLYGCVRKSSKKPWRLKRGLCETHYKAWLRAGRPDIHPEAQIASQE